MTDAPKTFCGLLLPLLIIPLFACALEGKDPPAWRELALQSTEGRLYGATSSLSGHGPRSLFDGSLKTCWAEGAAGLGAGESLYVASARPPAAVEIVNGYSKSRRLFRANARVRSFAASVLVGVNLPGHVTETADIFEVRPLSEERKLSLEDTSERRRVTLPFSSPALEASRKEAVAEFLKKNRLADAEGLTVRYLLRLRIADAARGRKYEDTCVSELRVIEAEPGAAAVSKVVVDGDHAVVLELEGGGRATLVRDPGSVFQLLEVSPDKRWAILIRMPAQTRGRAETEYRLYDLAGRRRVTDAELGRAMDAMYGFSEEGGRLFLEGTAAGSLEEFRVDLSSPAARNP